MELITDKVQSKSKSDKAGLMHLKMIATDDMVTTGSYNYTQGATTKNDEALVIIKDSAIAKTCQTELNNMWNDNANYANY